MTDHDRSDAFDLIRTDVQLRLRRYKRRIQKEAEAQYELLVAEQQRLNPNKPIDVVSLAKEALDKATITWLGINAVPQPAIEAGDGQTS